MSSTARPVSCLKNSDYWRERITQLEQAANKDAMAFCEALDREYRLAEKSIQEQIESWYTRLAKNNGLSMAKARKLLDSSALKEFKWDVNEYVKYGSKNALNQKWMKELENASAKYHISYLEAEKIALQQTVESLYGNQLDGIDKLVRDTYSKSYSHIAYEIQKGLEVGWDVAGVDENRLKALISKPWAADGMNFSDRIWRDKTGLINEIHTRLTQMCILGQSPDNAISAIAKKFNVSKNRAGALVMTESAFFSSAAQKDAFKALDVEKYEIIATLDSHTSLMCQEMDGKVFDMKDFEPGVTAPPFHVWCRSCTAPYFSDDDEGERAARGENGETYYVPADMKYPEWKAAFMDKGPKNGLKKLGTGGIIKVNKTKTTGIPNSITQVTNKKGGIDRNYYGDDGKQIKQISNNNHGNPRSHQFGKHGEHAHDYIWLGNEIVQRLTRELSEDERKENDDII